MEAQIKIYATDLRSASSADAASDNVEALGTVAAGGESVGKDAIWERALGRTRYGREHWEGLCMGGSIDKNCV